MAKGKVRGPKTQAVNDLLDKNPKMGTREIVQALAAQGMKITPSLVYNLKGVNRRKRRKGAVRENASQGGTNPAQIVMKVKELAVMSGGLRNLKQLVDALLEY